MIDKFYFNIFNMPSLLDKPASHVAVAPAGSERDGR
jgi:hypothetical protein